MNFRSIFQNLLGRGAALAALLLAPSAFAACTGTATSATCTSTHAANNLTVVGGAVPQKATVYPSSNVVSGMSGTISSVQVRLNGLTHTDPDDLDMVLVAPDGRAFVFWSDIGSVRGTNNACPTAPFACSISNFTITVSDSGSTLLPDGNGGAGQDARVLVDNTTYKPTNNGVGADLFPDSGVTVSAANSAANSPTVAGLGGTATFTSSFAGSGNINGEWKLYIALDSCCGPTGNDPGSLTSWSLILTTTVSNAATSTALTSTVNPSFVNNGVTITATVTAAGSPVTLGNVSFSEGAVALASNVPVNASGQASFTTSALTEGSHIITATYNGATGFGISSGSLTQVVDRPTTVSGNSFCNVGPITIPNAINSASVPYPSRLFVTGLSGTTQKITMNLKGFTHPVPEDVDLLLVSPTGQRFVPFASVAGIVAVNNIDLTLDDAAANLMPSTGSLAGGTYRPSAFANATFPSPAPAGPHQFAASQGSATFISTFSGSAPNGTWQLFAVSHGAGTAGARQFGGGWCLNFTTSTDPATTTTLSVSPTPSALNQSVTVSALVANATTAAPVNGLGSVNFAEGNTPLAGPLNLGSNGVASFSKSDFTQGAHFLTANYNGSPGNFGVSNGSFLHYVDAPTTNPSALRYCNTSAVTFPNTLNASGSPYPTRISVNGVAGTLQKVTVELNGLSHQFPDDVDMMLSGPNGNSLILLSDVGGSTAVNGVNLVLDSTSANQLTDGPTLVSGTFQPADFQVGADTFAAPAPTANVFSASAVTLGGAFNSINPNGIWTLFTTNDSAGAQGGGSLANGWCLNFTMNNPDLTISKTHSGNFTQGQVGATYSVVVGNSGPGLTAGTITVVDNPPTGLTITAMAGNGWNCTLGTRTCTTAAAISPGNTLPPITVTVNVATDASTPQVNSASVSAAFDPGAAGNNTSNDSTVILPVPDLTLSKTTSSTFVQGGTAAFSLVVNNIGAGISSGAYTISDNLPAGLTMQSIAAGIGWDCSASSATFISCVSTAVISPASSAPAVTVNVSIAANTAASITNSATVSGGGELNMGNNIGSVTVPVTAITPVTVTVPAGVSFTLNSVNYTGTQTVTLAPGQYVLSTTTPQTLGVGTRAEFVSWSDGLAIAHIINVGASPLSITGNFKTQHQLTMIAGTGGNVTPASGSFFDEGTVVNVTATPINGFSFLNWTGAVANPNAAATTVTMSAPQTVTANFSALTGVTVNVPAGVSFTLNSVNYTGSQTVNLAPGTYPLSTTTPQTLAAGTRAVFTSWSDAGAITHNITVGASPLVITGNFTTQHQLTTVAGAGGTVTPASGSFFDAGTVVNLTATPNSGFVFANWTGAVANANAAATTVTMSAPQTVTANFTGAATTLNAVISGKSGPANARVWNVAIQNTGAGSAVNALLNSLSLTQTFGAACTPVVLTALPASAGNIAPSTAGTVPVTIDFSSCAVTARFRADLAYSANAGAATGVKSLTNQFQ
ncbi:MAG: Ig-like domain repeat protein [Bryobacterales bacterium]|nr:Ig-like domain repeat protein [Bryobacterales bacterium]